MKLKVLALGQKDSRWSRKKLGTSSVTIGGYGCLLACHAMMLTYYGHEFLPDVLNEVYKTKGVFDQGSLINFYGAADVFGDITAKELYNCYDVPCDLKKIDKHLAERKPVIALVDFDLNPNNNVQTHFVLIIGKADDGAYHIIDPWYGDEQFFHARYGDPARFIYGLRLYDGTPKEGAGDEDKIADLLDKNKSLNEALAKKALEYNECRDALETQERDNKDLAGQLLEARSERDKEAWAKDKLEAKIKTLEEQIEKKEEAINQLKRDADLLKIRIEDLQSSSIEDYGAWKLIRMGVRKLWQERKL